MRETAVVKGEFMEAITVVKRQITQLVHCSPSSSFLHPATNQLMAFGFGTKVVSHIFGSCFGFSFRLVS